MLELNSKLEIRCIEGRQSVNCCRVVLRCSDISDEMNLLERHLCRTSGGTQVACGR